MLLMLFEGAQENTAHQIRHVIGLYGSKQNIREQYSQKLKSLQVNCWFDMVIISFKKENYVQDYLKFLLIIVVSDRKF